MSIWLQQAVFFGVLGLCLLLYRVERVHAWIDKLFDDPARLRKFAGWLVIFSIVEWAEAKIFGWVASVEYVSHLSQLAITLSTIPWWQGLRVEERQVKEDIPNEVVDKLIEKTDVDPQPGQGQASQDPSR